MNADRCNSQGRTAERGNKSAAWRSPDHVVAFFVSFPVVCVIRRCFQFAWSGGFIRKNSHIFFKSWPASIFAIAK